MFEIIPAEISGIDFSQFAGLTAKPGRVKAGWLVQLCNWLLKLAMRRDPAAIDGIAVVVELRERLYELAIERDRLVRTLTSTAAAAEQAQQELALLRVALGVAQRRYTDLLARREESLSETLLARMEATAELDRVREDLVRRRIQTESTSHLPFSSPIRNENREIGLRN